MLCPPDPYDRSKAAAYAEKWAFSRNPRYISFDGMGGDCTSFVSQCLYAGTGVMNFTAIPAGTTIPPPTAPPPGAACPSLPLSGGQPLGRALRPGGGARGAGAGDLIQLGDASDKWYHSLVTEVTGTISSCPPTPSTPPPPLSSYVYAQARGIHIEGRAAGERFSNPAPFRGAGFLLFQIRG
ncbi:MAG: amidase domain-containing protein [Anaerotruncus massiliensis (ex Togo et al. 2019)]